VDHVHVCKLEALNNCANYFPNVTDLTLDHNFDGPRHPLGTTLNRILPLLQVTKLVIQSYSFWFDELIELLRSIPNMHTLKFNSMAMSEKEYESIQQSESFRFVSNTNIIQNVHYGGCQLKHAKILVALFPRLTNLRTGMPRKEVNIILQFLLSKMNNNTHQLSFLCISMLPKVCLREVKRMIKLEKLIDKYLIKYVDRDLYLWW
jgi:hypothetical protein